MDVTDVKGLEGMPLGVARASFGHPVHLLSRQFLPIAVLILYPPIRDAVVVHLAREALTAQFLHNGDTYWKQSKRVFMANGL